MARIVVELPVCGTSRPGQRMRHKAKPIERSAIASDRFWAKVDASGVCWVWTAYKDRDGYGRFSVRCKPTYAHRVAFVLAGGVIDPELTLDHLCRNRACVRASHLEQVPFIVNSLRGECPPAKCARKTHCPKGHPYDEVNGYRHGRGRGCRECNRQAQRARRVRARLKPPAPAPEVE